MAGLTVEKCVGCRRDSPAVADSEINELRPQIPDWELQRLGGIPRLVRQFRFPDFALVLAVTPKVLT